MKNKNVLETQLFTVQKSIIASLKFVIAMEKYVINLYLSHFSNRFCVKTTTTFRPIKTPTVFKCTIIVELKVEAYTN